MTLPKFHRATFFRGVFFVLGSAITIWLGYYKYNAQMAEIAKWQSESKKHEARVVELQIELIKCQGEYNLIRSGLDDLPWAVWITDLRHNLAYVNMRYEQRWLEPLGKNRFDILGTQGRHIFGNEAVDNWIATNKRVLSTGLPTTAKEPVTGHPDKYSESTKKPIWQGGQKIGVLGSSYERFD